MGRWVLATGLLLGWMLDRTVTFSPLVLAVLVAFLAGGVILNVLMEQLPGERQSRYLSFAAGIIGSLPSCSPSDRTSGQEISRCGEPAGGGQEQRWIVAWERWAMPREVPAAKPGGNRDGTGRAC